MIALAPTLTLARRAWLAKLRNAGVAQRHSVVGYQTMRLGWTQWAYYNSETDETISEEEFERRYPAGEERARAWESSWRICGEMLTDEGRRILDEAETR